MSSGTRPRPIRAPVGERVTLQQVQELADGQPDGPFKLVGPHGDEVNLPTTLVHMLRDAAGRLGQGQAVMLAPVDHYVTTQDAANILNVSRPYVIQLLNQGEIPFTRLRSHRRIRYEDVLAYKRRRDHARAQALDELTRLSEEFGLYDMPGNRPTDPKD